MGDLESLGVFRSFEQLQHYCLKTDNNSMCRLCKPRAAVAVPSRHRRHVELYHSKKVIEVFDFHISRCAQECGTSHDRGHYHCPYCKVAISTYNRVVSHIVNHENQEYTTKGSHVKLSSDGLSQPVTKPIEKSSLQAVLVDPIRGIYAVNKSEKGIGHPLHVKKFQRGNTWEVECCNQDCETARDMAHCSSSKAIECSHLKATPGAIVPDHNPLLVNLESNSRNLSIGSQQVKACTDLREICRKLDIPMCLRIPTKSASEYLFFSIATTDKHNYCPLGRIIVHFHKGQWKCPCRESHPGKQYTCTHIAVSKWLLFSERGSLSFTEKDPSVEPAEEHDHDCLDTTDCHDDSHMPVGDTEHSHPRDKQNLDMLDYVMKEKVYPAFMKPELLTKSVHDIRSIIPTEIVCFKCKTHLDKPKLVTSRGIIVGKDFVRTKIKVYTKSCLKCSMVYSYKDYADGVHNHDNHLMLTLSLCLWYRSLLGEHTAIGRSTAALKNVLREMEMPDVHLKDQDMFDAYLSYEARSHHAYNFSCVVCGNAPKILILDVNHKGAFRYDTRKTTQNSFRPKNREDTTVDVTEFWDRVRRGVHSRYKSQTTTVEPDLNDWSPWIGSSVRGSKVYHSESFKVHTEGDRVTLNGATMITKEEFIQAVRSLDKSTLLDYCKSSGISGVKVSMSKDDILNFVIDAMDRENETFSFHKKFISIIGGSGGWLAACCPHGIVYALSSLLRAESPEDMVDLILSLSFCPHVIICDIPGRVAYALEKRCPGILGANMGMVFDPTDENIDKAKRGELSISLPWLKDISKIAVEDHDYIAKHPASGHSDIYVLYDELHKYNSGNPKDVLRHVNRIKELDNTLNTMRAEQLNRKYGRDHYFLDMMTPINHIFVQRLSHHLGNNAANRKMIMTLSKSLKVSSFATDSLGRFMPVLESTNEFEPTKVCSNSYALLKLFLSDIQNEPSSSGSCSEPTGTQVVSDNSNIDCENGSTVVCNEPESESRSCSPSIQEEHGISEVLPPLSSSHYSGALPSESGAVDNAHLQNSNLSSSSETHTAAQYPEGNTYDKDENFFSMCTIQTEPSRLLEVLECVPIICNNSNAYLTDVLQGIFELDHEVDVFKHLVASVMSHPVYPCDLGSLLPKQLLTDAIINSSLSILCDTYDFATFIPSSVAALYFGLDSPPSEPMCYNTECDILLIPLCFKAHWTLLIVYLKTYKVVHLDPKGEKDERCRHLLQRWVQLSQTDCYVYTITHSMQPRTDGFSCGVYILAFAFQIVSLKSCVFDDNSEGSLNALRTYFAQLILHHGYRLSYTCRICTCYMRPESDCATVQCDMCQSVLHTACATSGEASSVCTFCAAALEYMSQSLCDGPIDSNNTSASLINVNTPLFVSPDANIGDQTQSPSNLDMTELSLVWIKPYSRFSKCSGCKEDLKDVKFVEIRKRKLFDVDSCSGKASTQSVFASPVPTRKVRSVREAPEDMCLQFEYERSYFNPSIGATSSALTKARIHCRGACSESVFGQTNVQIVLTDDDRTCMTSVHFERLKTEFGLTE